MRKIPTTVLVLCFCLVSCARPSATKDIEEYDALVNVRKIYIGSFGKEEGAELIKEKIRLRLIKSTRFLVVEKQEQADAVLTGIASVQQSYHGRYSENNGSGSTRFNATVVLRLVNVKTSETLWAIEYASGYARDSASGNVADKTVNKLLKDAKRADEKAESARATKKKP